VLKGTGVFFILSSKTNEPKEDLGQGRQEQQYQLRVIKNPN
jgi:hypothetical protein